ncbi:enoyl-CoA hydratase/isomerase family protein [Pararhizobium sp. YC-54]|uniref:enoyl-CoA hydratase/isomerase family protein n=1 Tax=Pararhizobium sp. YC-54 TaxID=2986920 RepID=UPI0021F71C7C|nr:enoyl-CoA hydratase/isomerase family protein [Pararhizobium sp. YC-54]MCW0001588.1 enoyl-CoA hydratase/isomerase family protein [Pararhizobium sp. YC-54]
MTRMITDTPVPTVRRLVINRPEKRNALDQETKAALFQTFAEAETDPSVRCIVLSGSGGAFCSGGDLTTMEGQTEQDALARMRHGHQFVSSVFRSRKPLIAAVEGVASGAGVALALLNDFVVAGCSSKFSFPFIKLGLIPDWGLMHTLPSRVGLQTARKLMMTAATVDAREAERLGLVDFVVDDGEVQNHSLELAQDLASRPRAALAMLKGGLRLAAPSIESVLEYEAIAQTTCFIGAEFKEGFSAFRDKRPSNYTSI